MCALPFKEMVITGKSITVAETVSCRTHRELLRGLGHHASNALSVIKSSLKRPRLLKNGGLLAGLLAGLARLKVAS